MSYKETLWAHTERQAKGRKKKRKGRKGEKKRWAQKKNGRRLKDAQDAGISLLLLYYTFKSEGKKDKKEARAVQFFLKSLESCECADG